MLTKNSPGDFQKDWGSRASLSWNKKTCFEKNVSKFGLCTQSGMKFIVQLANVLLFFSFDLIYLYNRKGTENAMKNENSLCQKSPD